MTKSNERGENEITRAARQEATRTGRDVCDILRDMLAEARAVRDFGNIIKIQRAQKYLGCRNIRRRRRRR